MGVSSSRDGFTVTAHPGQRSVLLAFDLDQAQPALRIGLAGFAIRCRVEGAQPTEFWLQNLLAFDLPPKLDGTYQQRFTDSNRAPFQLFHWSHFPWESEGRFTYTVSPIYFVAGKAPTAAGGLRADAAHAVSVTVEVERRPHPAMEVAFTRGIMASQAFVRKFADPSLRPAERADYPDYPLFDVQPYLAKYRWLGVRARELVFEFLARAADPTTTLDVFAYDLDEPDVIRALESVGPRLRLIVDNSTSKATDGTRRGHGATDSAETLGAGRCKAAGAKVKRLHFGRLQHNKVMVLRRGGVPIAALTGSANFSIRGLYAQANHVITFDDAAVAGWYGAAFDQAWTKAGKFRSSAIAIDWMGLPVPVASLPEIRVSYAPHVKPPFSIAAVAQALLRATDSVLFSVMDPKGGGDALSVLRKDLVDRDRFLLMGTTENRGGVAAFGGTQTDDTDIVPFDYLNRDIPAPFNEEVSGRENGAGLHIHHKFVVADFNGADPVVYCGSSNLAEGGETSNGDNLIELRDRPLAAAFAIEAIQLYDHYRFRARWREGAEGVAGAAPQPSSLTLATDDGWVAPNYDPARIKSLQRERYVLSGPA